MAMSPQRLTIYLYSAHRAVIFAIAQLSCFTLEMGVFRVLTRGVGNVEGVPAGSLNRH